MTREEAIAAGLTHYVTGFLCFRGHLSVRISSSGVCCECMKENRERYVKKNPGTWKKDAAKRGKEKANEASKKSNAKRRKAIAAKQKEWIERNRAKVNAREASKRKEAKLRTPPWSDLAACGIFYAISTRVSKCTGIKFQVDHIHPLRGKTVSGLHVPYNLRVIPAMANQRKNNRLGGVL